MMAKKFAELQARMTPESRANVEQLYRQHLNEMPLHELRRAQELTQETLAKTLQVDQAAISRLERRTDMYISTLRNYIRGMGGCLGDHEEVGCYLHLILKHLLSRFSALLFSQ